MNKGLFISNTILGVLNVVVAFVPPPFSVWNLVIGLLCLCMAALVWSYK
jgi:hypothetical protein